jgi:nucleotide-binding universal stress UspA family protein
MVIERYRSYHNKPDAHQIIEDFRENQHHDTEDKADYSPDQAQITCYVFHELSPPAVELLQYAMQTDVSAIVMVSAAIRVVLFRFFREELELGSASE